MTLSYFVCWQDDNFFTGGNFIWGLLVYPTLHVSIPLTGRSPGMTEILLNGSLNQSDDIVRWRRLI